MFEPHDTRYKLIHNTAVRLTEIANPDFVNVPYEFWVGSDVPVGTSVGQVRIVSENPEIDYDLLHTYPEGGTPIPLETNRTIGRI